MKPEGFHRNIRISGKKKISCLFAGGKYFFGKHLKAVVLKIEKQSGSDLQFGISVPKKIIPKAVDRNLIKRRIRECIRKLKNDFFNDQKYSNFTLQIFFIQNSRLVLDYDALFSELKLLLEKIESDFDKIPID